MDRNKLFEDNMGLAYYIVRKYYPALANDEDIRQVAQIGLWKAAQKFDDTRGTKLSTLACWCIQNEIRMELRSRNRWNRLPVGISLDDDINGECGNGTFGDIIADPRDMAENVDSRLDAMSCMNRLTEKERLILGMRINGALQKEIGEKVGWAQSYVGRVLKKIAAEMVR